MKRVRTYKPPWDDIATCRLYLRLLSGHTLSDAELAQLKLVSAESVEMWTIRFGLGPLASVRCKTAWPDVAKRVQHDAWSATAENALHFSSLEQVLKILIADGITPGVLKGAALAADAWGGVGLRPMSDVDLWLPDAQMPAASRLIQTLGYRPLIQPQRPIALQRLAEGEIEFAHPTWEQGAIDLHWSPFPGWWYRYASAVDSAAAWADKAPIEVAGQSVWRLSAEDFIIHLASHLAVSAHLGPHTTVRTMLDIIFAARVWPVDWTKLAERAKTWRLRTAVWLVLWLTDALIGLPEAAEALAQLRPMAWRARLLQRSVSLQSIVDGRNVSPTRWRIALLVGLTDQPRDALRFLWRIAWPDTRWLKARYGKPVSHFYHFRQLQRDGRT